MASVSLLNEGNEHYFPGMHEALKYAKASSGLCLFAQPTRQFSAFMPIMDAVRAILADDSGSINPIMAIGFLIPVLYFVKALRELLK